MKNLAHACRILNIETPERNLPLADKADLLAQVKRQYRRLLKTEHPDKRLEIGLGPAHDRTVALGEAYRFLNKFLSRKSGTTITEWFERAFTKRKQGQSGRPSRWLCKPIMQFSRSGELIHTWPSIVDAERGTGVHPSSISNSANGYRGRKSAGGFVWRFVKGG